MNALDLQALREAKGLSREEVMVKLDVSLATVYRWENQNRPPRNVTPRSARATAPVRPHGWC